MSAPRQNPLPRPIDTGGTRAASVLALLDRHPPPRSGAEEVVHSMGGPAAVRAALKRMSVRIPAAPLRVLAKRAAERAAKRPASERIRLAHIIPLEPGQSVRRPPHLHLDVWRIATRHLVGTGYLTVSACGNIVTRTAKAGPVPVSFAETYRARLESQGRPVKALSAPAVTSPREGRHYSPRRQF